MQILKHVGDFLPPFQQICWQFVEDVFTQDSSTVSSSERSITSASSFSSINCSCRSPSILFPLRLLSKSHYDTLGVKSSATPSEIKSAYLKKCKEVSRPAHCQCCASTSSTMTHYVMLQLHPDSSKGDAKSEQFTAVNEAYSVLRDVTKRKEYDEMLNPTVSPPPPPPPKQQQTAESKEEKEESW